MILAAREVTVHYGKVEAVRNASLDVEEGTIVTLIGANGAGKSTVLKTISGLKTPTSGTLVFEEMRIDNLLPQDIVKRGISHVPEGRRLFPRMMVIENLKMGAYLRRRQDDIRDTLNDVYNYFPVLKERQKQRAGSLSGGEQQMLAIGRALMSKPKLLLLDEPSIGLSPLVSQTITKIIAAINREHVSILLVEQNAKLALRLSQQGYVMETGSIVLSGPSIELMRNEVVKSAYLGV
jgi:branched-chain amino acid transport system ATP-binding protein